MAHETPEYTGDKDLDSLAETMNHVYAMYGVGNDFNATARDFCQYAYRKFTFGHPVPEDNDWSFYAKIQPLHTAQTTRSIRGAIDILKQDYDVDIMADRGALRNAARYDSVVKSLKARTGDNGGKVEATDDNFAYIFATDIANLFGGSKQIYRNGIAVTEQVMAANAADTNTWFITEAQRTFYRAAIDNISGMRYEAQRQFRYLCSDEVTALLDFADEVVLERTCKVPEAERILESEKQQLDYTILPAGTELRDIAADIIRNSKEYEQAHVDLKRLKTLEDIRQEIGVERCFWMHGRKSDKSMSDGNGTLISEDYIGLVIQHHDENGIVTREDCVAISPIARKHAGYITRQDASEGISWREVLSMPKNDAIKFFNARRLRFDPVNGEDKYDVYVKKVLTLLECPKEQFSREYVLRRKGESYSMSHRGKPIGEFVTRATVDIETKL